MVHEVLAHFGNYVREETLTVDLVQSSSRPGRRIPAHLPQAGFELGGKEIVIAVSRSERASQTQTGSRRCAVGPVLPANRRA